MSFGKCGKIWKNIFLPLYEVWGSPKKKPADVSLFFLGTNLCAHTMHLIFKHHTPVGQSPEEINLKNNCFESLPVASPVHTKAPAPAPTDHVRHVVTSPMTSLDDIDDESAFDALDEDYFEDEMMGDAGDDATSQPTKKKKGGPKGGPKGGKKKKGPSKGPKGRHKKKKKGEK